MDVDTVPEVVSRPLSIHDGAPELEKPVTASVTPASVAKGSVYGPFRVVSATHVELVGLTGKSTPALFAAMLKHHPGLTTIDFVESPGTEDDLANLRVGRMIRENGLITRVPAGGSVRSGGVELFIAGTRRVVAPDAEFAVHAWLDSGGFKPTDYDRHAPENLRYLNYYRQMGMSVQEAEAFYAMTNSVPFDSARWLGAQEMARWVKVERPGVFYASAPLSRHAR